MTIINFGHCIKKGKYNIHSEFKNVFNYSMDKDIVSLVSSEIGSGPNNIVLKKFPKFAEQSLIVSSNKILIGNTALKIDQVEPQVKEDIFINDVSCLLKRIDMLSDSISDKISYRSLGFLLFPKNEIFFKTTFEKAFLSQVKQIVQDIFLERLPVITKRMKGIGFGLTPSGDDFNCGVLYALNYINCISNKDLSELIEECYSNSLGNNPISNTFLKFAYSNHYYENFYRLLKALKQNKDKLYYTGKVINSGHTSGADMLTGFILTIKGVLNDKKPC